MYHKKINVRLKLLFVLAGIFCIPTDSSAQTESAHNQIAKCFVDRFKPGALVYCELVLYFDHKPHFDRVAKTNSGAKNLQSFYFPNTQLASTVVKPQTNTQEPYTIHLRPDGTGVKCIIEYDDTKVILVQPKLAVTTVGNQQALFFRLCNKQVYNAVVKNNGGLLRVASLKKKPIIGVDFGHGGTDTGAIGCFNICEKDITREVGSLLLPLLEKSGCQVVITRSNDATVNLDERATLSNMAGVDLVLSIHANSSPKPSTHGIETFYLSDKVCDTFTTNSNNPLLTWLRQRCVLSKSFADAVHNATLAYLKKEFSDIVDRTSKPAITQILTGIASPAILIEIGFLSNQQEAQRLANKEYQLLIAQGICNGVMNYLASRVS